MIELNELEVMEVDGGGIGAALVAIFLLGYSDGKKMA